MEIIEHFRVKSCLCPVKFQGLQRYLLTSCHLIAVRTLFSPPYSPVTLHYASYEKGLVETWSSSCKFHWKNLVPSTVNQDSFCRLLRAFIIPFRLLLPVSLARCHGAMSYAPQVPGGEVDVAVPGSNEEQKLEAARARAGNV